MIKNVSIIKNWIKAFKGIKNGLNRVFLNRKLVLRLLIFFVIIMLFDILIFYLMSLNPSYPEVHYCTECGHLNQSHNNIIFQIWDATLIFIVNVTRLGAGGGIFYLLLVFPSIIVYMLPLSILGNYNIIKLNLSVFTFVLLRVISLGLILTYVNIFTRINGVTSYSAVFLILIGIILYYIILFRSDLESND